MFRVFVLLAAFFTVSPSALAAVGDISWEGDAGYRAEVVFNFDERTAPSVVSGVGTGPTDGLDELEVWFYDPDGALLASYVNVTAGVSTYGFLQFFYNQNTGQLEGLLFDVGADSGMPGEYYFFCDFTADTCGINEVIDDGFIRLDTSTRLPVVSLRPPVPIPATSPWSLALLCGLTLLLAGVSFRRQM